MRTCAACDSTTTYRYNGWEQWHNHDGSWLCSKCFSKYVYNALGHSVHHPRRIHFKGKDIQLKENPRKGICELCGNIKGISCQKTNMHHLEYHPEDPLKDTIELCPKCHWEEHKKLEAAAGFQSR